MDWFINSPERSKSMAKILSRAQKAARERQKQLLSEKPAKPAINHVAARGPPTTPVNGSATRTSQFVSRPVSRFDTGSQVKRAASAVNGPRSVTPTNNKAVGSTHFQGNRSLTKEISGLAVGHSINHESVATESFPAIAPVAEQPQKPIKQKRRQKANRSNSANIDLSQPGYLRLWDVLTLIPVSRSKWYAGIKAGQYPPSTSLGAGRAVGWDKKLLAALLASMENESK
jgi:predicted DNA-binding transcriptional regulator AlpA